MDDRGEKIVTLARAILQNPVPVRTDSREHYSLKTVVLAAILSAAGTGAAVGYAAEHFRPLNRYEKIELQALIHYAGQKRHIEHDKLQADFFHQFGVASFDELTKAQLEAARIFLQKDL